MAERRRPAPALVAVVVALLVAVSPVGGAGPALAQAPPAPRANLVLEAKTSWWTAGQPFFLTLSVEGTDPAAFDVAVTLYRSVRSRTEFSQTVQGRLPGRPVGPVAVLPVAELPLDGEGNPVMSFTPAVEAEGVYPLRVELRPHGEAVVVDSFVTHLVHARTPAEDDDELAVAWVVPVTAPPAVQPDGHVAIDDGRAEQLAGLARSLDGHPGVALTLAATPETVEALGVSPRAQDRGTHDLLARSLRQRQLLASPYVPTNLTAMLAAGLEGESATQLTEGAAALRRVFGAEPAADVRLVDERLSGPALAHLRSQDVDRLVIPEVLLDPVTRNTTLAELFHVDVDGQPMVAAMADAGFAAHFGEEEPVLAAHRLLADLAVV
ncbi:MAG TPA: hypothetical protein VFO65_10765, partial [Acidimicrobiales bacterium]|nr:hypothetical protein [Acidimicrobiales bacterium]